MSSQSSTHHSEWRNWCISTSRVCLFYQEGQNSSGPLPATLLLRSRDLKPPSLIFTQVPHTPHRYLFWEIGYQVTGYRQESLVFQKTDAILNTPAYLLSSFTEKTPCTDEASARGMNTSFCTTFSSLRS